MAKSPAVQARGSGPRVGFIVGFFHSFDGDVGVDLGGAEAGMTEQ